jgi:hypothetical protein
MNAYLGFSLTLDLVALEGDVAYSEIQVFVGKINKKFQRIEPKLIALNEIRKRLSDEDTERFESFRKDYIEVKMRLE